MFYIFVGIAVFLFAVGIYVVLKPESSKDVSVVPFAEVERNKAEVVRLKEKESSLISLLESAKKDQDAMLQKVREFEVQREKKQIESAAQQEKTDAQIIETAGMINSLRSENATLISQLESLKQNPPTPDAIPPAKVEELNQEIARSRERENSLRSQSEALHNELVALKTQYDQLKSENASAAPAEDFKSKFEELSRRHVENVQTMKTLKETVTTLTNELQAQAKETQSVLEQLKKDKEILVGEKLSVEEELKKIKDIYTAMLENEESIQYELTKKHAQSLGTEKLNEDFKIEVERNVKEISELKGENKTLSKRCEEAETSLAKLREQHGELTRNEKLAHYELEKTKNEMTAIQKTFGAMRSKSEAIENKMENPEV